MAIRIIELPRGHRMAPSSSLSVIEQGSPELHILNFVTRVPRLLAALPGAESSPSWAPDGEWIAFTREVEGEFDLLRIHPDGGRLQDLLVGEGRDVWPRWSPDGERLLFFSRRDTGGVDDEVHELTVQTGRIRRITRRAGHDFLSDLVTERTNPGGSSHPDRWIKVDQPPRLGRGRNGRHRTQFLSSYRTKLGAGR